MEKYNGDQKLSKGGYRCYSHGTTFDLQGWHQGDSCELVFIPNDPPYVGCLSCGVVGGLEAVACRIWPSDSGKESAIQKHPHAKKGA